MAIQERQNGEEKQQTSQEIAEPTKLVDRSRRSFTKSGLVASGVLLTLASRPVLGGGGGGGGKVCQSPSGFVSGNLSQHGTPHSSGGGYSCQYWMTNCDKWPYDRSKPLSSLCSTATSNHWGCNVVYSWQSNYASLGYKTQGSGPCYSTDSRGSWIAYTLADILCGYHLGHNPTGTSSPCTVTKNRYGNPVNNWYTSGTCGSITSYRPIPCTPGSIDELAQQCVKGCLNAMAGLTTPYCTVAMCQEMFNACNSPLGYYEPTAGVRWSPADCIAYLKSTEGSCTYYG